MTSRSSWTITDVHLFTDGSRSVYLGTVPGQRRPQAVISLPSGKLERGERLTFKQLTHGDGTKTAYERASDTRNAGL